MNRFMISLLVIPMIFCLQAQEPIKTNKKPNSNATFIDKIETKDPEVQKELDKLKKDFINDRDAINRDFEIKKENLKKQKKKEMEELRNEYKKRIKSLKKKHPQKINSNKKVKPLDKKNSDFEDPRKSDNNTPLKESKNKRKPLKPKK